MTKTNIKLKKNRGMTLVELIIAIAILAIIVAAMSSILMYTFGAYNNNKEVQQEQHNTRLALLSISRQAHRGVDSAEFDFDTNELTFTMYDGTSTVKFYLDSDNILKRDASVSNDEMLVPFVGVELSEFNADVTTKPGWATITVKGKYGKETVTTTISLTRIPDTTTTS